MSSAQAVIAAGENERRLAALREALWDGIKAHMRESRMAMHGANRANQRGMYDSAESYLDIYWNERNAARRLLAVRRAGREAGRGAQ